MDSTQRTVLDQRHAAGMGSVGDTLEHLNELILALDRRVPQVQRVGEAAIAKAAAELRMAAINRIAEIKGEIEERH
jgi:hypothetical protein